MSLNCIDGQFGSGKTWYMAYNICRLLKQPNTFVFTNVKMHVKAPNLFMYKDIQDGTYNEKGKMQASFGIHEILKIIGVVDNYQRSSNVKRKDRLKFYIFQDETGIIFNQHLRESFPFEIYDYLLQVRKINVNIYFGVQKFKNITKQFREHIERTYYFRPLFGIRGLNKIGSYRRKMLDSDGFMIEEEYTARDDNGNLVTKRRPIDQHIEYVYKPPYYKVYDDLDLIKKFENPQISVDQYQTIKDLCYSAIDKNNPDKKPLKYPLFSSLFGSKTKNLQQNQ